MKFGTSFAAIVLSAWLAACGGGSPGAATQSNIGTTPTVSPSVQSLANICTQTGEKSWVRAHLDDVYLWYKEIVEVPAASYATPDAYFQALLVKSRDRFSFSESQSAADGFFVTGEDLGYGAHWLRDADNVLRVSYVEPDSPAAANGIGRGTQIVGINGSAESSINRAAFLAALYPTAAGQSNQFEVRDVGAATTRVVALTSRAVALVPVPLAKIIDTDDHKKVGYLVFHEHIAAAGPQLISAINAFKNSGIDDLVLDVRYNGGGYVYIANELASMLGGAAVQNQVFLKLQNNDKHAKLDNVDYFDATDVSGQALPQLGLKRVFVLTSSNSCSASEAIVNGLSPFMQVITIGGATCGKPYGMRQTNNCGTAYFAISFQDVNSIGQLVPSDGYAPACAAGDNTEQALGAPNENLLSAALQYRATGSCPTPVARQAKVGKASANQAHDLLRPPLRNNLFAK